METDVQRHFESQYEHLKFAINETNDCLAKKTA